MVIRNWCGWRCWIINVRDVIKIWLFTKGYVTADARRAADSIGHILDHSQRTKQTGRSVNCIVDYIANRSLHLRSSRHFNRTNTIDCQAESSIPAQYVQIRVPFVCCLSQRIHYQPRLGEWDLKFNVFFSFLFLCVVALSYLLGFWLKLWQNHETQTVKGDPSHFIVIDSW